ncbi:MAG: hypothetical protein LBC86_06900 [Oscillospiraceae bacterium]|jgi:hypothetical protein|nr:hypothetical protein [Oscillospiraceae bacterium]
MNLIICNESCRHQQDGYCCLEGSSQITNALASPCCYYEETDKTSKGKMNDNNSGYS